VAWLFATGSLDRLERREKKREKREGKEGNAHTEGYWNKNERLGFNFSKYC
jgi:hypothetical protein